MTKLSFVYFDVGGVMIQDFSDSPKWGAMMDEMGIPSSRHEEFDTLYHEYDTAICLGQHEDTLLPIFAGKFDLNLKPGFSMRHYFLDHFFTNNRIIWSLVAKLKKTIKLGLLTDMYPGMLDEIFERKLMPPRDNWDVIIDSTQVGFRKPMKEIYRLAEEKAGVPAGEILFIDNRQKNLDIPASMGWQTFHYDSSDYEKSSHDLLQFIHAKFSLAPLR